MKLKIKLITLLSLTTLMSSAQAGLLDDISQSFISDFQKSLSLSCIKNNLPLIKPSCPQYKTMLESVPSPNCATSATMQQVVNIMAQARAASCRVDLEPDTNHSVPQYYIIESDKKTSLTKKQQVDNYLKNQKPYTPPHIEKTPEIDFSSH